MYASIFEVFFLRSTTISKLSAAWRNGTQQQNWLRTGSRLVTRLRGTHEYAVYRLMLRGWFFPRKDLGAGVARARQGRTARRHAAVYRVSSWLVLCVARIISRTLKFPGDRLWKGISLRIFSFFLPCSFDISTVGHAFVSEIAVS